MTGKDLLGQISKKDDNIVELKKKVEELKRESLNADWVSLQEEITEYRVILGQWTEVNSSPINRATSPIIQRKAQEEEPEPEPEEEEEEEEDAPAPAPVQLGKRKRGG